MVSTRKKKQQNKRLFGQFNKFGADFMIKQNNHEAQVGTKTNVEDIGTSSNSMNGPIQVNSSHTWGKNRYYNTEWIGYVMTTVETEVQNAVLTVVEKLLIPRVEVAMKSANASSGRSVDVTYWNLTRGIFRPKSKAYKWSLQVE